MESVYKIFVTAPKTHTEQIINAMSEAGAGRVGNYTHCAYITHGTGTHMPKKGANPYTKAPIDTIHYEPEDKVEMICVKEKLTNVIKAIKSVHPYETPTIDVVEIQFYN